MDGEFESVEPFGIDDGELDGLSPQECFVLGYELAQIHELAEHVDAIIKTVHVANKDRIEESLRRRGRTFRWQWPHDDVSESWIHLAVDEDTQTASGPIDQGRFPFPGLDALLRDMNRTVKRLCYRPLRRQRHNDKSGIPCWMMRDGGEKKNRRKHLPVPRATCNRNGTT